MPVKREYRSGGITWVTNTKVRLSVRFEGGIRRTKTVTVVHRDRGGRSAAALELERFHEELRAEAAGPRSTGITVAQMLQEYVDHSRRIGRAQGTVETYVNVFKKRVTTELGSLPLEDLTARDLDELYGELAARGMGASSIRATHKAISAAIEQAIKWGRIDHNPARLATPPRGDMAEAEPLTPGEVAQMAITAAAPRDGQENGDLVLTMAIILAALTGARRGELCGFRWDDVDEGGCSITIQRQWVPGKGGQRLEPPKSKNGTRRVYLGVEGMRVLEQYRAAMWSLLNREPEGWLLSHDAGVTPMRAKALGAAMSKVGSDCGLDVTTHRFRKVQATQLVAAGVDVDTAARRMGHTKQVMLGHYVLGAEDKSVAAAEIVEARLIEQGLPIGEIFTAPSQDTR
jgi:integrase